MKSIFNKLLKKEVTQWRYEKSFEWAIRRCVR